MFWKNNKLKIPKKDYCDFCDKFSLIKITDKEAIYACGTKIKLQEKFDDIFDLLTISKFCQKAFNNKLNEDNYIVEIHKQKLGWI